MATWRKICCALDFSAPSRAAFEQAAELAVNLHAELLLVHVRPPAGAKALFAPPGRRAPDGRADDDELRSWTREAQERAGGLATSLELGGEPADEIARCAQEFGCDLVVVGTHGRTGLRRAALGSVAEGVVQLARCPVLVVPAPAAAP
ncbi:universal stress protein [Anaeromyxobacter diazotrophicus]|uniref:Universal stress protein A n=1 Tax=Anaeromyxobacter diazotrophicus TaxID=2590199 RepID=A0A7I9VGD7_9BACT|nr:universal stress protein [Anaeromyxobacter diazotrophicus]GEJ55462.1 universal stress protein A [Anaeromyxobacter diazotrophicus]